MANTSAIELIKGVIDGLYVEGSFDDLDADAVKCVSEWVAEFIHQHDKKIAESVQLKKEEEKAKKRLERVIASPAKSKEESSRLINPKSTFFVRERKVAEASVLRDPKVAAMKYKEQNAVITAKLETMWTAYVKTNEGAAEVASYEVAKATRGGSTPTKIADKTNIKFGYVVAAIVCSACSIPRRQYYYSVSAESAARVITEPKQKSIGNRIVDKDLYLIGLFSDVEAFFYEAMTFDFTSLLTEGVNYRSTATWWKTVTKVCGPLDEELMNEINDAAKFANELFTDPPVMVEKVAQPSDVVEVAEASFEEEEAEAEDESDGEA